MEQHTVVSHAQPVFVQGGPAVIHATCQGQTIYAKEARVLGLMQITIGILAVGLGIPTVLLLDYYTAYAAYPLWAGVWIIITGSVGLSSSRNPNSIWLNGTYMAFNTIACLVAFINTNAYAFAVAHYKNGNIGQYCDRSYCTDKRARHWKVGLGIYIVLLVAMLAEFIIALTASVYCCKGGCACCGARREGIVIQPGLAQTGLPQHVISQYSHAQPVTLQPGYPGWINTSTVDPLRQPPKYDEPYYTSPAGQRGGQAATILTYSEQIVDGKLVRTPPNEPPPVYS